MEPRPRAGFFIFILGKLISSHTPYFYAGHLELWKDWYADNAGITVPLLEAPGFADCPSGRVDKAVIDGVEKWVIGVGPDFPDEWKELILDDFQLFALPKREIHWEEDTRFLGMVPAADEDPVDPAEAKMATKLIPPRRSIFEE